MDWTLRPAWLRLGVLGDARALDLPLADANAVHRIFDLRDVDCCQSVVRESSRPLAQ